MELKHFQHFILCIHFYAVIPCVVGENHWKAAVVGERVVLECRLNTSFGIEWDFYRFNRTTSYQIYLEGIVPDNFKAEYEVTKIYQDLFHLVIRNATLLQAGKYICKDPEVSDPENSTLKSENLVIIDPSPKCSMSSEVKNTSYRCSADETTLDCIFFYVGAVTPVLKWNEISPTFGENVTNVLCEADQVMRVRCRIPVRMEHQPVNGYDVGQFLNAFEPLQPNQLVHVHGSKLSICFWSGNNSLERNGYSIRLEGSDDMPIVTIHCIVLTWASTETTVLPPQFNSISEDSGEISELVPENFTVRALIGAVIALSTVVVILGLVALRTCIEKTRFKEAAIRMYVQNVRLKQQLKARERKRRSDVSRLNETSLSTSQDAPSLEQTRKFRSHDDLHSPQRSASQQSLELITLPTIPLPTNAYRSSRNRSSEPIEWASREPDNASGQEKPSAAQLKSVLFPKELAAENLQLGKQPRGAAVYDMLGMREPPKPHTYTALPKTTKTENPRAEGHRQPATPYVNALSPKQSYVNADIIRNPRRCQPSRKQEGRYVNSS